MAKKGRGGRGSECEYLREDGDGGGRNGEEVIQFVHYFAVKTRE